MRAAIIALMLMFGSQAGAECGKLCDLSWLKTATEAEVQAELDSGADVIERNVFGHTPLHLAVSADRLVIIQVLLRTGADVMARDQLGFTPLLTLWRGINGVQRRYIRPLGSAPLRTYKLC